MCLMVLIFQGKMVRKYIRKSKHQSLSEQYLKNPIETVRQGVLKYKQLLLSSMCRQQHCFQEVNWNEILT